MSVIVSVFVTASMCRPNTTEEGITSLRTAVLWYYNRQDDRDMDSATVYPQLFPKRSRQNSNGKTVAKGTGHLRS